MSSKSKNNSKKGAKGALERFENEQRETKKKIAGDQYLLAFSKKLSKIYNRFQVNRAFNFKFPQFKKNYTDEIAKALFQEVSQSKIKGQRKSSYNFQTKQEQTVMEVKGDYKKIISVIQRKICISENEENDVEGDYDIIISAKTFLIQQQRLIQSLRDKIKAKQKNTFWVIKDYLETNSKKTMDENQQAIHIFQLKRSPFIKCNDKNFFTDIMQPKEIDRIASKTKDQLETYEQQFIYRCIQDNMLHNISQMIKIVYACISEQYRNKLPKICYQSVIHEMRTKNQYKYNCTLQLPSDIQHPTIVLYYVINNKLSEDEVREKLQFFRPILKHFFLREKAILNIIGFSERNDFEILQEEKNKKWEEKYKSMEEKNYELEEKYKSMEEKNYELEEKYKQFEQLKEKNKSLEEKYKSIEEKNKKLEELVLEFEAMKKRFELMQKKQESK